ncbi:hypothetical protein, partial [Streptomyces sp. NPDC005302]|uniref:hypothetical protein n=1 Tax=Streptomyces sp. NPDC005302 TaxID=3154675 RepID=UPI0033A070F8
MTNHHPTKAAPAAQQTSKKSFCRQAKTKKPPTQNNPEFAARQINAQNKGPRQRPDINHREFAARRIPGREIPPGISLGAFMPLRP